MIMNCRGVGGGGDQGDKPHSPVSVHEGNLFVWKVNPVCRGHYAGLGSAGVSLQLDQVHPNWKINTPPTPGPDLIGPNKTWVQSVTIVNSDP